MMSKDQIERITEMEGHLDKAAKALEQLGTALDAYAAAEDGCEALEKYYINGQWRSDFEDDEAGKLPADLKRGVLSEDAVYDLLTEHNDIILRMLHIVQKRLED